MTCREGRSVAHYCVAFAALWLAVTASAQDQQYVTDEIVITMRTGPSNQNAIIRNLSSGDSVTILERQPDGDYARVRASDGDEGWVLVQYLQADQTGDQLYAIAVRELDDARARVEALEDQVSTLTVELDAARAQLEGLRSTESNLSSELAEIRDASANAIGLRDANESLRRRVTELDAQLERALIENGELRGRSTQNWFIIGAAVLLLGIVVGLVAPSLRPRRKSGW